MPASDARAGGARVRREGPTLVFAGALTREVVAPLWKQAQALAAGAAHFDLGAVERVDSAGLALLAELAARAGNAVAFDGEPAGFAELCAAYRLDRALGYAI